MENTKRTKRPFFARFLEAQDLAAVDGAGRGATGKSRNDQDDGGTTTTMKYPSDNEDDGGGVVTMKYPSDDDEEGM
jgi:hypothetical protein